MQYSSIINNSVLSDRFFGVEDHGQCRINQTSSNYDKLSKDINTIINILQESVNEVRAKGSMHVIEKCTVAIKNMSEDDVQLIVDMEKNEQRCKELKKIYEQERVDNINTIEETDAKIQTLKFCVEDVLGLFIFVYAW